MAEEFVPGTTSSSAPPVAKDPEVVAQALTTKRGLQEELLAAQDELYEAQEEIKTYDAGRNAAFAKRDKANANIGKLQARIAAAHLASK